MRDDDAFLAFARSVRDRLWRTAVLLSGDPDVADDLVGQVLVRLYVGWPRLRGDQDVATSAATLLAEEYLDSVLEPSGTQLVELSEPVPPPPPRFFTEAPRTPEAVRAALAELSAQQRTCAVLRYVDDLGPAEAATALRSGEHVVEAETAQAVEALEARLGHGATGLLPGAAPTPGPRGPDLAVVVAEGRRRARRRTRLAVAGVLSGLIVVGIVAAVVVRSLLPTPAVVPGQGYVVRLEDAVPGAAGRDYRVIASWTTDVTERPDLVMVRGVTDDGQVLFEDRHFMDSAFLLLDPRTGAEDPLPPSPASGAEPLELSEQRLVLLRRSVAVAHGDRVARRPMVWVYDRALRTWRAISWPGLAGRVQDAALGPDGRIYLVRGGRLWSASPDDPADVRDEDVDVGELTFSGDAMVWTPPRGTRAPRVHVRDVGSGAETTFDPRLAAGCEVLDLVASGDVVGVTESCDVSLRSGMRVLTTGGVPVAELKGAARLAAGPDGTLTVTSYGGGPVSGTYVYDPDDRRLVAVSGPGPGYVSPTAPTPSGTLLWTTLHGDEALDVTWAEWLR